MNCRKTIHHNKRPTNDKNKQSGRTNEIEFIFVKKTKKEEKDEMPSRVRNIFVFFTTIDMLEKSSRDALCELEAILGKQIRESAFLSAI